VVGRDSRLLAPIKSCALIVQENEAVADFMVALFAIRQPSALFAAALGAPVEECGKVKLISIARTIACKGVLIRQGVRIPI
jgi:hypothetical protein